MDNTKLLTKILKDMSNCVNNADSKRLQVCVRRIFKELSFSRKNNVEKNKIIGCILHTIRYLVNSLSCDYPANSKTTPL